jgi:hypothetical protein
VTAFDEFLVNGGLPFRIINTKELSKETNIPFGMIQWLDTGYEISSKIKWCGLTHESLKYVYARDQMVMPKDELVNDNPLMDPEFFFLDGKPFLCHYKKGSAKTPSIHNDRIFSIFMRGVSEYLDKTR